MISLDFTLSTNTSWRSDEDCVGPNDAVKASWALDEGFGPLDWFQIKMGKKDLIQVANWVSSYFEIVNSSCVKVLPLFLPMHSHAKGGRAAMQAGGLIIKRNCGFGVLLKDTSTGGTGGAGYVTLWLMDGTLGNSWAPMSSVSYKVTDTVNENINQSYSSNWKCQYDESTTTIGWVTMVFCIDIHSWSPEVQKKVHDWCKSMAYPASCLIRPW